MSLSHRLSSALQFFRKTKAAEADLHEEVNEFYRTTIDRLIADGLPEQEAKRLARLRYGGSEQTKQTVRESRSTYPLEAFLRDIRYACRTIRKAPGFGAITITALAAGIGANSTIFAIVNRFVLTAPPVREPSTLVALHTTEKGACCNNFSWPLFRDIQEQTRSFRGVAAYYDLLPASIGDAGEPERVWGQAVSANFFDVAQLSLPLGRGFAPTEEKLDRVVLGYGLWQRRFGGDPAIIGKAIHLSTRLFTVIGVAPPGFRGLDLILDGEFWIPLATIDELLPNTATQSRDYHWLNVVGRLRPGVANSKLAAELSVIATRVAAATHLQSDQDLGFRFDRAGSLPPRDRAVVMLFLASLSLLAFLVLCIACTNVANLSFAQAVERRAEMSVRLALGAARSHLLRQLTIESVLLSLAGGVGGVLLSLWATQALRAFRVPAPVPLNLAVTVDASVLLYTFVASLAAGILFGLVPAWLVVRSLVGQRLTAGGPGRLWTLRNLLVISQIAMSVVLLSVTGLFLRSLNRASRIEIGFRTTGLVMMSIDPRLHGYTPQRTDQLLTEVRRRVSALPGVVSVACTDAVPLSGGHRSDGFVVQGRPNNANPPSTELYMASPGYFDIMGIKRVAGRDFTDADGNGARVAVVNQEFVRVLFPNENPIGQQVRDGEFIYRIIGVVGNTKSRTLGENFRPVLYRTLAQNIASDPSSTGYTVIAQYANAPGSVAEAVRKQIHDLDPALAAFDSATIEQHLRDALFLPRLAATLFGIFGSLGLLLTIIGLYGLMSYWVTRHTREIGIRLAVGATAGDVLRGILRQGMTLTLVALTPGFAAAWAGARLLNGFLYSVPAHDRATFVFVPLFVSVVSLAACWFPARKAARVDPCTALRHD